MRRLASAVLVLLLVNCTLSLPSGQGEGGADSDLQPATASQLLNTTENDIFDHSRISNGTVIIRSATEYFAGALGAYYSIPRSAIDTVRPGPLPYGKQNQLPCLAIRINWAT